MTQWSTPPEQWARWTQEEASAAPRDALDAFDAELARRLDAAGFAANLEQTSVTNPPEPHPSESDATLIRPSPVVDGGVRPDEFGDAAETIVNAPIVDGDGEPGPEGGYPSTLAPDALEVGLAAPESDLEVGLEAESDEGASPSEDPEPASDDVDGLILPSLTTRPPEPEPEPEPAERVAMHSAPGGFEAEEGGTVVAPAPVSGASGETMIAPAPTGPELRPGQTLIPTDAPATSGGSHEHEVGGTEVAPVRVPVSPRTGDTLPPISEPEPEPEPPLFSPQPQPQPAPQPEPDADTKTSASAAASSGVFQTIDIHDDDEPEPVVARQKVVVGVPTETPSADTNEIDELDEEAIVEEDVVEGDIVDAAAVVAEEVVDEHTPPPVQPKAPKPPPAPKGRAAEAGPPEAPPPEMRPEPRQPSGPISVGGSRAPGWPEEVFAEHFVAMTRPNHAKLAKAEADFFVESTGVQPGARVLDVGCGDGTHALVLAQRGFAVTGLDLSFAQLSRAQRAKETLGSEVELIQGDMRDMPVKGTFEAILCIGTTFGYYDDEENRAALKAMASLLAPGGRLLLHVFNRDHIIGRLPTRSWWQGHGCLVLDEAQMNFFNNRLSVHRTIVFEDGRQFEHRLQIRGYNAHELGRMCVDAGLRIVEISGDRLTRGRFYGASSPDIWLLVEPKS